ncbi:MAG TPA: ABC transporter substrate-binding protein [Trueperaceae bacterium]|jgi:ABC-type transport system substrate-binding protein
MGEVRRSTAAGRRLRHLVALLAAAFLGLAAAKGTITVGAPTEPPTLDPQLDAGGPSSVVQESIFETLVAFDQNMVLQPHLATGWEVSDDGLEYTFTLREGVTFHDGTPLNAEAVKFTFDRALGEVDGRQSRYVTLLSQLDRVEVVDDLTVRFVLKQPFAPFINNLAQLGNAIISPTAYQELGDGFGRQPVGTGPFRIVEWVTGQSITLERNPDYWQDGLPLLDGVVFRYIPDGSSRVIALESGEVDLILQVPEPDFLRLEAEGQFQTYKAETLRTVFLWFNPNQPPFDDVAVREAITMAVDREGIGAAILEGLHRPATQASFSPNVFGVSEMEHQLVYDPEAAAAALDAAGWQVGPDGIRVKDGQRLSFTLYTTTNRYPKDAEIGAYLRASLARDLGAEVELGTYEWETYRDHIFAKDLGLFLFGAGVSTGDIDYVMTIIFHSSSTNYNQYVTSVDDDILTAQTITDPEERVAAYREILDAIAEEYLWVPLYWQSDLHAARPGVEGFAAHPLEKVSFLNVSVGE